MKLESHLRQRRDGGRKLLVPYVTGGFGADWLDVVRACAAAGADAIEIGIPFSDPVMDGPIIQAAAERALQSGATPAGVISALAGADVEVPLIVMSYANPVFRMGAHRCADLLATSGVDAIILPDVPPEEMQPWWAASRPAGIETILLASPLTTPERMDTIASDCEGFLYCISLLGVTGERDALGNQAKTVASTARSVTSIPALLGLGISTPAQAVEASTIADGVIVGSAIVRRMIDGEGPTGVERFVSTIRVALDS